MAVALSALALSGCASRSSSDSQRVSVDWGGDTSQVSHE